MPKSAQLIFSILLLSYLASNAADSLRTETVNGKRVIVHKVDQGQTLYSLARKYQVNVNDIKALNPGMAQLQIGAEVLIPAQSEHVAVPTSSPISTPVKASTEQTHVVQQGETLYRIARNYGFTPQEISEYNKLGTAGIKVGQELSIPSKGASPKSNDSAPLSSSPPDQNKSKVEKHTSASGYPSITESGNAQVEAALGTQTFYSVGHKSAPVGTLVFIKNKENGNTVHARVTSNQTSTSNNATILWINQTVMNKLEAKAANFPVEISYTPEK